MKTCRFTSTAFLSYSSYDMQRLAHLMNVLFSGRCGCHISFSGTDMSGSVWNSLLGNPFVDMEISSINMKSPSPKFKMTFWGMAIYSDTLHWSDISLTHDLVIELDINADFNLIACTIFRRVFIKHLQRVQLPNRGLTPPDIWSCPI